MKIHDAMESRLYDVNASNHSSRSARFVQIQFRILFDQGRIKKSIVALAVYIPSASSESHKGCKYATATKQSNCQFDVYI